LKASSPLIAVRADKSFGSHAHSFCCWLKAEIEVKHKRACDKQGDQGS
jgi:hypothetical protein